MEAKHTMTLREQIVLHMIAETLEGALELSSAAERNVLYLCGFGHIQAFLQGAPAPRLGEILKAARRH